jgi:hypothetical protein
MASRTRRLTLLFICAIVFFLALRVSSMRQTANPEKFDPGRWKRFVEAVRQQPFVEERMFRIGNLSDPNSLQAIASLPDPHPYCPSIVIAQRDAGGNLSVLIAVIYGSHGEDYGYVYSDQQEKLKQAPEGDYLEFPGEYWLTDPGGQIDEHWWRVSNDLN